MAEPAGEDTNSKPAPVGQSGGKRSAWIAHIKSVAKAKGIKFGEAMKIASKTFKGGQLTGKGVPMGGKRTKKNRRKGGALYGFGGGNGNASADGGLADGSGAYGHATSQWAGPSMSALTGGPSAPPATGGRRSRRHRRRRGSSKKGTVGGKRRR